MIQLRPAAERGHTKIDWLDSWHSFSFSEYYDPKHMNFGHLRVINEDWVDPEQGFGTHGHRDMEIITYVVEGELEHKDSLGNGSTIRPGDVQRMTAGTGVRHSEFNPSKSDRVHLLQIWITPEKQGLEPGYEQRSILDANKKGQWQLLASRDGRDGSVTVHQDVSIQQAFLGAGDTLSYPLGEQRQAWVQMVCGKIELNSEKSLSDGDAASITNGTITLVASEPTELLLFDLAK